MCSLAVSVNCFYFNPGQSQAVTARAMSSGPMPFNDEKMPFYALGVNLAKQVGGQTGFNSLLNEEELDIVLTGFSETLRGTSTQDANVGRSIH